VKRKAFKTSPSVRIPRAAVERLQESKAQAQAQAAQITSLQASVSAAAHDNAIYVEALRDLMGFFNKVAGSSGSWCVAEVKRIEQIRLLSLGV
jgi:hypothetical protein